MTCFIIINQLVLWDPPVNYYSVSRRQRSTYNPRYSASWHQLSGTLCLQLQNVLLPSPLSRHIWKLNCSLLHTTRSNIFFLPLVPPFWQCIFLYLFVLICNSLCFHITCRDQFARAFHRGSRPGSALSGNVPSPIDHVQGPLYGQSADEQLYKGVQVMPGQLHILTHSHTHTAAVILSVLLCM